MTFGIIGDLQKSARGGAIFKTIGDLAEATTPANEAELLAMLDEIADRYSETMAKLSDVRARMVANLTPEARAAASILGQRLTKALGELEERNLATQRALIKARNSRGTISKGGVADLAADLATLREHSRAVLTGKVVVPPDVSSRLAKALSVAEVALAEAVR